MKQNIEDIISDFLFDKFESDNEKLALELTDLLDYDIDEMIANSADNAYQKGYDEGYEKGIDDKDKACDNAFDRGYFEGYDARSQELEEEIDEI